MNGGIWGTTGRTVLAAVSVFVIGAHADTPARAADLGGDCCADLEERIAELEATTVRKGTKKVSLTVSGQVNKFLLFWDDGEEENVYIADSTYSSSRIRFVGVGKIDENWSAGYNVEFETIPGPSAALNQIDDNGPNGGILPNMRQNYLYLKDKRYGEVRLGMGSTPSDDIVRINTAGNGFFTGPDWENSRGFFTRADNGTLTGVSIGNLTGCYAETTTTAFDCPSTRRNVIHYVSPDLMGFIFQAAYGEDDLKDVAIRYKKDFTKWKVAGGIGYAEFTDERENMGAGGGLPAVETNALEGSISAMHIPTGLYGQFAFNHSEIERGNPFGIFTGDRRPDGDGFYIEGGIKRKWNQYGATGFFGTYANTDDQLGGIGCYSAARPVCDGFTNGFNAAFGFNGAEVTSSNVDRWGLGAVQQVEAASLDLFVLYEHTDFDVNVVGRLPNGTFVNTDVPLQDFQSVIVGARLIF